MNGANTAVSETTLSLPGGVSIRSSCSSPSQVWSYADLHGDDTVTADQTGARPATDDIAIYDPFGDQIDLASGLIGTAAANSAALDTSRR